MISEQLLQMQEPEPFVATEEPAPDSQVETGLVLEFTPRRPTEPLSVWAAARGALPVGYDETKEDGMFADDYEDYDQFPHRQEDLVYGGRW